MKIVIVSGTNRSGSQTLRIAKVYEKLFAAQKVSTEVLDLTQLPAEIFTPAAYANKPASFARFNDAVLSSDGLFVVTPEYNGSFPGVLKVFIDMLTFPQAFEKRAVAFTGLAAGQWGALRSVEQLSQIFAYRNANIFAERIFLPRVETAVNAQGEFTVPLVNDLVHSQVKNFVDFAKRLKA
jgi:chromate reductase, NAD(P)H dehydrogenase (quinone)